MAGFRLEPRPRTLAGLLGAVLATAAVAGLSSALEGSLRGTSPWLLFVVAVMAAAWYGGMWAGLLATALAALTSAFLFVEPVGSLLPMTPGDQLRVGVFLVVGFLISALCGDLHSARREAKARLEELEESEERFRFLAETLPSIVWTAGPDGTITYANHRWLQYCALSAQENARDWPRLVLHPDDLERCVAQWTHALSTGTEYEIEVRNRRFDGVYRWFLTRAVPQKNASGEVTRWFGVTTDIHDRKEMEGRLREADRRKDEFLATLAHELRNPLAPIKNAVDVLRLSGPAEPDLEWAREVIDRQVDHLTRLIEDLLDLSRITRDKLELRKQRVELARVIQGAVESSRPLIDQRNHQLTVALPPEPIHLDADDVRLVQVLMNLLTNAAKYTPAGGRIWLTAERVNEGGEAVELRVKDTGVGIAAEKLPRIFEMFYQVDGPHERSAGGLGLGLTLVRRLVELHGGRVMVASDGLDQGSEFTVRLPVLVGVEQTAEPEAAEAVAAAPRREAAGARRILVVDDNRDAAQTLALLLRLSGAQVEVAHDGLEAVAAADRFRPGFVLLDIGMPHLNGYNAARRIREQPWGRGMVLVALTGWGQEEDRRKTREAGFDAHLTKPVDHAELMALLEKLTAAEPADAAAAGTAPAADPAPAESGAERSPTAARNPPSG